MDRFAVFGLLLVGGVQSAIVDDCPSGELGCAAVDSNIITCLLCNCTSCCTGYYPVNGSIGQTRCEKFEGLEWCIRQENELENYGELRCYSMTGVALVAFFIGIPIAYLLYQAEDLYPKTVGKGQRAPVAIRTLHRFIPVAIFCLMGFAMRVFSDPTEVFWWISGSAVLWSCVIFTYFTLGRISFQIYKQSLLAQHSLQIATASTGNLFADKFADQYLSRKRYKFVLYGLSWIIPLAVAGMHAVAMLSDLMWFASLSYLGLAAYLMMLVVMMSIYHFQSRNMKMPKSLTGKSSRVQALEKAMLTFKRYYYGLAVIGTAISGYYVYIALELLTGGIVTSSADGTNPFDVSYWSNRKPAPVFEFWFHVLVLFMAIWLSWIPIVDPISDDIVQELTLDEKKKWAQRTGRDLFDIAGEEARLGDDDDDDRFEESVYEGGLTSAQIEKKRYKEEKKALKEAKKAAKQKGKEEKAAAELRAKEEEEERQRELERLERKRLKEEAEMEAARVREEEHQAMLVEEAARALKAQQGFLGIDLETSQRKDGEITTNMPQYFAPQDIHPESHPAIGRDLETPGDFTEVYINYHDVDSSDSDAEVESVHWTIRQQ